MPPDVLAALDPEQRQAAEALRGPVCILAGAGTGKTRAITHRIANMVLTGTAAPGHLLAVTFTTRAAGEMRGRLRALGAQGVQARTFHSAALRQLQYFWPRISGGGRPTIIESKLPSIRAAAARTRLPVGPAEQRDLAAEVEWAKNAQVTPDRYTAEAARAGRQPPFDVATVQRVFAAYEEINADRGQLDFEDLLLLTAAAIEEHRDIAREVRERYRYFVVDEYQDVNPLQQRLLDAWLHDRDEICVVGDPNQTIYSFTGASPSYLLDFPTRFPDATVVRLVRDYRSTNQVVAVANRVIPAAKLQAQGGDGPEPTFGEYDDEPAEAAAVARQVASLAGSGVPLREMAVLFRVNAQSEVFESAFAAADVPYVLRGGERFFDRPEVRQGVVLLRGAARSIDPDDDRPLPSVVADVLTAAGFGPQPPSGQGAARERWESLRALVGLAEELVAGEPAATLETFVAELAQRAETQHAPAVEGVTLASLHAAKGLEWDAVFLVGLVDGTLPITYATTPAQVEEERRLLYVGVTRARRHLSLSWALARAAGGRRGRKPSPFLDGVRPRPEPGSRPVRQKQAGGASVRSARPELAPEDETVFERLRAWRLEQAREEDIPAYRVFDDKTLVAIVQSRPATLGALARVSGVGPRKLDDYGEAVLALLRG